MRKVIFLFCLFVNTHFLFAQEYQRSYFTYSDTTFEFGQVKILYGKPYQCFGGEIKSLSTIDSIVIFLKKHSQINVEIGSHTDSRGNPKYNLILSQKRAHAVFDSLVYNRIDSTRLSYKGYGAEDPIVSNTNKDGSDCQECRAQNRRLELKITQTIDASKRQQFQFADTTFVVGEVKIQHNIYYNYNYPGFRPESFIVLDSINTFLKNNPRLCIEISSHTDGRGNPLYNAKLSRARAQLLYDYLVERGIDTGRLIPKGYAGTLPIAPNTSEEGRQENRRTELKITKINYVSKRMYFQFSDSVFEAGEIKMLNNVYYAYDSSTLRPVSFIALDSVYGFLKMNPRLCVEIGCHTDNRKSMEASFQLSQGRAQQVYDYLVQKGIDKNGLSAKGYGASVPRNANDMDSPEERRLNRRTELKIAKILY